MNEEDAATEKDVKETEAEAEATVEEVQNGEVEVKQAESMEDQPELGETEVEPPESEKITTEEAEEPSQDIQEPGKKQLICVAFDNCGLIESWKNIRDFSLRLKSEGKVLPYTFFISAVKLLAYNSRKAYDGPDGTPDRWNDRPKAGQSNIGFGGPASEVRERIDQINLAIEEGHEIASHGVGHFFADKLKWTASEWFTEFWYFNELITNVAQNHGFDSDVKVNLDLSTLRGFRAPYLQNGAGKGLYTALSKNGFSYDTSDIIFDPGNWPSKFSNSNIWNFGLPLIDHPKGKTGVNLSGKSIPMDWNWFFFDVENKTYPSGHPKSGRLMDEPDSGKREQQKQGMLDAYISYFEMNYSHPDRPPIHIGHHFTPYNKGIYWGALQEFILEVIDKPDVEFITYKQLVEHCNNRKEEPVQAQSVKQELIETAASSHGIIACGEDCC